MAKQVDRYLKRALDLSEELCSFAEDAERHADGEDFSRFAFYGLVRDCAYRIQRGADKQMMRRPGQNES